MVSTDSNNLEESQTKKHNYGKYLLAFGLLAGIFNSLKQSIPPHTLSSFSALLITGLQIFFDLSVLSFLILWISSLRRSNIGNAENKVHQKEIDNSNPPKFWDELDKRVLKGAISGKSYSPQGFDKLWKLLNFSSSEVLGLSWRELNREKIEKQLSGLDLKIGPSNSPTCISFDLELILGETVDCSIFILKNRLFFKDGIHLYFGFVDRNAEKLVEWLQTKYGKSLRVREDTQNERCYDWSIEGVSIAVDIAKSSGLGDMTLDVEVAR